MEEVNIEVSDEDIALEVGYAIVGRATDIHENPHDDFEHVAEELRNIGREICKEYGDDWTDE